jgi:hypothetical protein
MSSVYKPPNKRFTHATVDGHSESHSGSSVVSKSDVAVCFEAVTKSVSQTGGGDFSGALYLCNGLKLPNKTPSLAKVRVRVKRWRNCSSLRLRKLQKFGAVFLRVIESILVDMTCESKSIYCLH